MPHLSIGEVLGLLLEEFPDVTISKIRFLESQGLIDPERTPSGYRKFYDDDVELLRCILREQRENYLPLRVIKDRIDSGEIDPTGSSSAASATCDRTIPGAQPSLPMELTDDAEAVTERPRLFVRTDGERTQAPTARPTVAPISTGSPAAPAPVTPTLLPGLLLDALNCAR